MNYFNISNSSLVKYFKYPSSSKYFTTDGNPDFYRNHEGLLELN